MIADPGPWDDFGAPEAGPWQEFKPAAHPAAVMPSDAPIGELPPDFGAAKVRPGEVDAAAHNIGMRIAPNATTALDTLPPLAPGEAKNEILQAMMGPLGRSDVAATIGSKLVPVAPIASGLAGLFTGLGNDAITSFGGTPDMTAADAATKTAQALSYEPKTTLGKAVGGAIDVPFEAVGTLGRAAGEKVQDKGGSPLLSTVADTAVQALPMLFGAKKAGELDANAPKAPALKAKESVAATAPPPEPADLVAGLTETLRKHLQDVDEQAKAAEPAPPPVAAEKPVPPAPKPETDNAQAPAPAAAVPDRASSAPPAAADRVPDEVRSDSPAEPLHPWTPTDTESSVPLAGGVSQEPGGPHVVIDKRMPASVDVEHPNGGTVPVDAHEAVGLHERTEFPLMHLKGAVDEAGLAAMRERMGGKEIPAPIAEKLRRGESLTYAEAHDIATHTENQHVRTKYGVDPEKYQAKLAEGIKAAREKAPGEAVPENLDRKPYEQGGDEHLLDEQTNSEAPAPGKKFVVYRFADGEEIGGRNAGNADAVARYIGRTQDFEAPQSSKARKVTAYEVTAPDKFGDYAAMNKGQARGDVGGVGRGITNAGVEYSFPKDFQGKKIGEATLDELHAELGKRGYRDFDESGSRAGAQAIRDVFANKRKPKAEPVAPVEKTGNPITDAFAEKLQDHPAAVEEYSKIPETEGGTLLNVDIARELSPDYLKNRTKAADVHEPASAFIKRVYKDKLAADTPPGKDREVLFTAGGTGAGKSTGLAALGEAAGKPEIVFDTNMNGYESAKKKIDQALEAGRKVKILYTYRDPVEALRNGALKRAARQEGNFGSGRTVPLAEHEKTHVGSYDVVNKIGKEYNGDARVEIVAVDNSRGMGNAAVVPLDQIPNPNKAGLREALQRELEEAHSRGEISDAVRAGFEGSKPGAEVGAGDRGQSQPQREARTPDEVTNAPPGSNESARPGAAKPADVAESGTVRPRSDEPKVGADNAPSDSGSAPSGASKPERNGADVRNAATDVQRATLGLEELASPKRKGWAQSQAEAAERMKDQDYARNLAREVVHTRRAIDDVETMALGAERLRLQDAHKAAEERVAEAIKSGDAASEAQARMARESVRDDLDMNFRATDAGGTPLARAMAARNAFATEDFSTAHTLTRARNAYGEKFSKVTEDKLRALTERLEQLQKEREAETTRKADAAKERAQRMQERLQKKLDEMEKRLEQRTRLCPI